GPGGRGGRRPSWGSSSGIDRVARGRERLRHRIIPAGHRRVEGLTTPEPLELMATATIDLRLTDAGFGQDSLVGTAFDADHRPRPILLVGDQTRSQPLKTKAVLRGPKGSPAQ